MNIYLIGFRCTGKTTVGKIIADTLHMKFMDADDELVKQQGMPISDMVKEHGWTYFREKESNILEEISKKDNQVVSTGGGVILNNDNVVRMKESGTVIWLKASPETVADRMQNDEKTEKTRPALTSKGLINEIEETIETRIPLYEKAMMFAIDTDNVSIEAVAKQVIEKLDNGY